MTWRGMCGSGWRTGMMAAITATRQRIIRAGRRLGPPERCGAARGTAMVTTCGCRIGAGALPTIGAATSVFAALSLHDSGILASEPLGF
jgi:hypothetical protein